MDDIVLVVGAGASRELGFPTGWELMKRIIGQISVNEAFTFENYQGQFLDMVNQFLNVTGRNANTREEHVRNLLFFNEHLLPIRAAMQDWMHHGKGLDAFLIQNNDDSLTKQFGKFAIGYYIMGYEEELIRENYYAFKNNWLRVFLEHHLQPVKEALRNGEVKIRIITFNYDRVIEHYLYNFLRHTPDPVVPGYDSQSKIDQSWEIVERFGIIHVYNKIADLEWQLHNGKLIRFGERNNDKAGLQSASEAVRLIAEQGLRRASEEEIKEIRSVIKGTDRVYMLGFGFDPDNMDILFGPESATVKERPHGIIHATAKCLPEATMAQYPYIKFHRGMTCYSMMKEQNIFTIR